MRRLVLSLLLLIPQWGWSADAAPVFQPVVPGVILGFPADHGAHPGFRTEWWYFTGWLKGADGRDLGFQITFFRTRPEIETDNPSRFAPTQVMFAHAALSDPALGHLLTGQRIARQGFGLAGAATGNADIILDDWSLLRAHDGHFTAKVAGEAFSLDLTLTPTQPILEQGEKGVSRKGPAPGDASYYYSMPHVTVGGMISENGRLQAVTGEAWLDREWSSSYLDPEAVGWDWLGINLQDGGAVTLFQIRDRNGAKLWAGGSWRSRAGDLTNFSRDQISFVPGRLWHSPRTGGDYPIAPTAQVILNDKPTLLTVTPLFDDQELDSRMSGGPVYWEGAVTISGGAQGRGYLELTGYAGKLKL
jgi:predicted secreted hydrolase